ncbi:MAG: hypothetical protein ABSE59_10860, partial [Opitutaceae bacterium]
MLVHQFDRAAGQRTAGWRQHPAADERLGIRPHRLCEDFDLKFTGRTGRRRLAGLARNGLSAGKNRRAARDHGQRIDRQIERDPERALDGLAKIRRHGRAAHKDQLLDGLGRHVLLAQDPAGDLHRFEDDRGDDAGDIGAGKFGLEGDNAGARIHLTERNFEAGFLLARELDLGGFGGGFEPPQIVLVARFAAAERFGMILGRNPRGENLFDDRPVEVGAAQEIVAAMVDDVHGAVARGDERGVEGAATEIEHEPAG